MTQPAIKIVADDTAQKIIAAALKKYDLSDLCHFESHDDTVIILCSGAQEKPFPAPVRLGKIIDQIKLLCIKAHKQGTSIITFGEAQLNTHLGTFQSEGQPEIILTEKEVEILVYLQTNKDRIVSREELLDAVWNYAKDVETHTLETHIYRLRQKIEADPANPVILKTKESGYCV
mgnify:FL=1|tara:strand:- start:170 stop:694 length:525 start_codon:yes stop_codon:yes gene_type:complete